MNLWQRVAVLATLSLCVRGYGGGSDPQTLSERPAEQLLRQSREAYTIFARKDLSRALAAKGTAALPQLGEALGAAHWHVRHCALIALKDLAATPANRAVIEPLVPKLAERLLDDPSLGVRVEAAECLAALASQGKAAQIALAKAAAEDPDQWVRASASAALTAVEADLDVMMPVYESMIRSTDKLARGNGIRRVGELHAKGIDIAAMIPALMDVFRKPIYDANYSGQTRAPAMQLLNRLQVDTRELVPFITRDLATTWRKLDDGYHPYQKTTLQILGRMGANGEAAIPVLEEVAEDPSKFGCDSRHPDYETFIGYARESIERIRTALNSKGVKE